MKTVAAAKLRRATPNRRIPALPRQDRSSAQQAAAGARARGTAAAAAGGKGAARAGGRGRRQGLVRRLQFPCPEKERGPLPGVDRRGETVSLVTVGSKASRYFSKTGMAVEKAHNGVISRLQFADAVNLAAELQELVPERRRQERGIRFQ